MSALASHSLHFDRTAGRGSADCAVPAMWPEQEREEREEREERGEKREEEVQTRKQFEKIYVKKEGG